MKNMSETGMMFRLLAQTFVSDL